MTLLYMVTAMSGIILGYDEMITAFLEHADNSDEKKPDESENAEHQKNKETDKETIKDVFDSLTEDQKKVVYGIIGSMADDSEDESKEEKTI